MEKKSQLSASFSHDCILVGGHPRSGTSLISGILNAVPEHCQAFELHIRKPSFIVGLKGNYTRRIFEELGLAGEEYDEIVSAFDLSRMNLGSWAGPKELVSAEPLSGNETSNFTEELMERCRLAKALMERVALNNQKKSWGFKLLSDVVYADIFADAYPRSKFIFMVRDPRDNALSILSLNKQREEKKQQKFYDDLKGSAEGWTSTLIESEEVFSMKGINHIVVRYEDLVLNKNIELKRLSDFLNMDLFKGLNFYNDSAVSAYSHRFPHHDNLRNPINSSSVGKWKEFLSLEEKEIFENVCGSQMRKYGYNG